MARARSITRHIGGQSGLDAAIADLAARQHGVVARAQLLGLGFGDDAIEFRLRRSRLHRLQRGVYAVGHSITSRHGRMLAALLACGPGAVLSHRSAAALWGLRPFEGRIEVTTPGRQRRRPGLIARRSALQADEITEIDAIAVTSVARTLLDLGQVLNPQQLEKTIREAEFLRLLDLNDVRALLERYPRRAGSAALRKTIEDANRGSGATRSALEDRFVSLLLTENLPRPTLNATLELNATTIEVDCLWQAHCLIVELDGHQAHATRSRFESDRARDRMLQAKGFRVIRITWRQLHDDPQGVAADLRILLVL